MSLLSEREVVCPACKQPVAAELWSSVNVKEDPELKDILLGGELNIVECAACKEKFHVDAFLLYHDPDNEIFAFVFPDEEETPGEQLQEKMNADFELAQATLPEEERLAYAPINVRGLDALVRFVEQDEEVALQAEVLEAIARQSDLPVRRLSPFSARQQALPRVLPVIETPGKTTRDAVITGLKRLKEINDRLTIYTAALDRLSQNPAAEIRFP